MKKLISASALIFLFSSCSLLPMSTDVWINRKLENVRPGSSKEQVLKSFGNPIYRIRFARNAVEVWGYDLGHYWYHESVTLFFKENRFIGVPQTPYDLMVFMHQLGLMDPSTEFLPGHTVSS